MNKKELLCRASLRPDGQEYNVVLDFSEGDITNGNFFDLAIAIVGILSKNLADDGCSKDVIRESFALSVNLGMGKEQ